MQFKLNPMSSVSEHVDPVVRLILNTPPDPIEIINVLESSPYLEQDKVKAILALARAEVGLCSQEEANTLAEQAYHKSSHVDLHLLFLGEWYSVLSSQVKLPIYKIKSLEAAMNALISSSTPAEIKSIAKYLQADTAAKAGNYRKKFQLVSTLLENVSPISLYYPKLMVLHIMSYLCQGLGAPFESELNLINSLSTGFDNTGIQLCEFIDNVLRGNLDKTLEKFATLASLNEHKFMQLAAKPFEGSACLLWLMCKARGTPIPHSLSDLVSRSSEPWVLSTDYLLSGQPAKALEWAQNEPWCQAESFSTQIDFARYALVRAELASGNGKAANRLLLSLRDQGTETYIDHFYFARAQRLLGNFDSAHQHFKQVKEAVIKYKAQQRFEFEKRIALELSQDALEELETAKAKFVPVNEQLLQVEPIINTEGYGIDRIVSVSQEMNAVKLAITQSSDSDLSILITGETGTGKELVARALHESSPRKEKPFLAINCAAIPDTLIESELFGYAKGAFTGAGSSYQGIFLEAEGGTVFLDEIGEISPKLQAALLRVLESKEVRPVGSAKARQANCRVIAASNCDLSLMVSEGRFRQDLFYRLQRFEIWIPPLRTRKSDIQLLAEYFFNLNREKNERTTLSLSLIQEMQKYNWPGNVRELRNIVERMRILSSDKTQYDIEDWIRCCQNEKKTSHEITKISTSEPNSSVEQVLYDAQSTFRRKVRLRELFNDINKVKVSEVASILNVSRSTASRYLKELCEEGIVEMITPNASPQSFYYVKRGH